jgi:polyphosphate:AMP phosphotransferase
MFETAEVGNKVGKTAYEAEVPRVRTALLELQHRLAASDLAVVVIVSGVEGAGKEETVDLLMAWLDARGVEVHAMWDSSDEEQERPRFWRFWRVLPPRGRIGVLFGSWYTQPIVDRAFGRMDDAAFERGMHEIVDFERMLADERVVLIKYWMHLSKAQQEKQMAKVRKNPERYWRVTPLTRKFFKKVDKFSPISEKALRLTDSGFAPWHIVEAADSRYRNLTVARTLLATVERALNERAAAQDAKPARPARPRKPELPKPKEFNVIRKLDLTQSLTQAAYRKQLERLQPRLNALTRALSDERRSMIIVFEGPDAAGKGGAIRRISGATDARLYQVHSVAAPTDEELAHPYLWRFWRALPRRGRITVYDRSWYGRVLVERIEGFCAPEEWQRAYAEINAFEQQLVEAGTLLCKFWLAISPEEQLKRFHDRKETPYKQYKLTEEDWRNRAKWDAYEAAACDMIERTSTDLAPWTLVEANDKNWARIKVMRTVCDRLQAAFERWRAAG